MQWCPAQAFHGQPDLLHPLCGGDGQLFQRSFAQHSIGSQRMALLKGLHGVLQGTVVGCRGLRVLRQVAQRRQSLRELHQTCPGLPRCEFALGQRRQWLGPGGVLDQASVLRKRVAQAGVERQVRCSSAQRVGQLRTVQRCAEIGHWVDALQWLNFEVGMDLAWVDAARMQIAQVAVQRRRQVAVHLCSGAGVQRRALVRTVHGLRQPLGVVVLRQQAFGSSIRKNCHGLLCCEGGATSLHERCCAGGMGGTGQRQQRKPAHVEQGGGGAMHGSEWRLPIACLQALPAATH